LYESRAIARYIATKYADQGTPLLPKDLKAYGLFEQAASVEVHNFHPYASKAVGENVFKKCVGFFVFMLHPVLMPSYLASRYRGLTPDPAVYEAAITALDKNLIVYDQILEKQKYLAGNVSAIVLLFVIADK
jgi:glutathione S-transferase